MTWITGKLSPQAWMITPETRMLMEILSEGRGEARFVGGCVRDALINRKVTDVDIATNLLPQEVMDRFRAKGIDVVPTGLMHGTVTVIIDHMPFQVTTLRKDVKTNGRHADVAFTDDWLADAERRDFTINAMSATIEGDVYDPFGGIHDLRVGRVVFVGNAERRIEEDYLRILRYFRFFAQVGQGEPDSEAVDACRKFAPQLAKLSSERIRDEILKLLDSERCLTVWKLMVRNRIVTHFLPEATNVVALEKLMALESEFHSRTYVLRRLAVLIETTRDSARHITDTLRLSRAQASNLLHMLQIPAWVLKAEGVVDVRKLVYRTGNDMARNMLLLVAARHGRKPAFEEMYAEATSFRPPMFPLVGTDILNLGWQTGPDIGRILAEMEDWWLANDFKPGRGEALKKLEREYPYRIG